jgi:hypothetical protein
MKFSGLWKKFSGKFKRRAAFGIDAAIMIGFILAMMIALATFGPQILQWFAGELMGGSNGAYALLIELPTWDPTQQTPTPPTQGASPAQWVGYAACSMYGLLQKVALGLLSVVLIIAAMCYLLETFRVMNEGTAVNIIMNSAFSLIMIFAIPYIYNYVADAINAFTGWSDVGGTGLIITGGHEIDTLIAAMGGGVLTGWDVAVRFFGSVVIFIICTSLIMLAVMMGAVRLLLIGCLAAALPLLIMLRLIPPVKHLADSLIETVIGIMFASVIAAILIHFGYILVAQTSIGGITKLVIALATIAGAAYMSTMFAGRLGGLFVTMGGMASQAPSMATGLMLGGAAWAASGVTGLAAGAAGARGTPLAQRVTAALKGAGAGLAQGGIAVLPGALTGRGPGRVLQAGVGALPAAKEAGISAGMQARAGSMVENTFTQFAAAKAPGEQARMGLDWYDSISKMSDKQVGQMFNEEMGLTEIGGQFDPEKGGREIKKALAQFKEKPEMLDRVRLNMAAFKKLPKDDKWKFIDEANQNVSAHKAKISAELGRPYMPPNLEAYTAVPGFYQRVLTDLGSTGTIARARMYSLAKEGFEDRLAKGELSAEKGLEVYRKALFDEKGNRKSDVEVAEWAAEKYHVHLPENDALRTRFGDQVKEFYERTASIDPRILHNMELEYEKRGGNLTGLESDLSTVKGSADWLDKLDAGRLGERPMGYAFQREAPSGSAKVEAPYKALSADELRRGEHPRRLKDEGRMPELSPPTQKPQKATLKPQPPQQTTAKETQPVEQPTTQPTQKQPMEQPQPSKSQPPKEVVKKKKGKKYDTKTAEGQEGLWNEYYDEKK